MIKKGKFIILYGINNLGKSLQLKMLQQSLEKRGISTQTVKYPIYEFPTGQQINAVLRQGLRMSELDLQKLYAQNRLDFEPTLQRYLNQDDWVLAEDYRGTGMAWGMSAGVKFEDLVEMNNKLYPEDLSILLYGKRFLEGVERNHLNEEDEEKCERSQKAHLWLAKKYGWKKILANQSPKEVHQQIMEIVNKKFHL